MSFAQRLEARIRKTQTPALVGLDPRFDQLPIVIQKAVRSRDHSDESTMRASAFEEFCCRIIDVVAPLVPAVKPQAAFFEELGPAGCTALARVMQHARRAGLVVICDAKRGDIGSTAEAYARGYLAGEDPNAAGWAADALTVNPYLGKDTLEPFVKVAVERGAGIYVLVRTSNPGSGIFQDRLSPGDTAETNQKLYRHVADVVEEFAAETTGNQPFGCVGAVVGATYPEELGELRDLMPHAPFLIPGYGSQGGTAADVAAGFTSGINGALINSSRAINFAYHRKPYRDEFPPEQWEDAVLAATKQMIADLKFD